jgi:hypothetical protein
MIDSELPEATTRFSYLMSVELKRKITDKLRDQLRSAVFVPVTFGMVFSIEKQVEEDMING